MLCTVIRAARINDNEVKVTFAVPDEGTPVAVIGCFNDWDRTMHPLRRRSNGTRSVAVIVPVGQQICFRYVAGEDEHSVFFDDPDADALEPNGFGATHSVLTV